MQSVGGVQSLGKVVMAGIGKMGWPIAANLVRSGVDLVVNDVRSERAAAFVDEIGGAVASVGDGCIDASILVTMLPTSAHVVEVVDQAEPSLRPGAIIVDMSSGSPAVTRALAERMRRRGVAVVDCPVSGGVARAESATLSIMAGGDAAAIEAVAPLLAFVGSSVHHCGGVGAGQAMKALNNLVSAAGFLAGIEALLVGARFGLDPSRMVDVLNASTGANNSTQRKFHQFVLSRSFDSGFELDLMAKDLAIAAGVARDAGVATPFSALCVQLWAAAASMLGPGRDHTEMACFSESLAGFELSQQRATEVR